jgi:predicted Abi (CAAX) family protease
MLRRATWLAALMLLAVFAFLGFSLRADTAAAAEYVPPTTPFTEPALGFAEKPCFYQQFTESTGTEKYLNNISATLRSSCELAYGVGAAQTKRLFWLVNELIKAREQIEGLKAELVKGLGTEGAIAKGLAQLHTDLTLTEGLPIRWKSQAAEPEVKFKSAQAVTVASLPELAAGTKAIGTVKVTSLEGEPAIKVGNEPAVKVSALPELAAGTKAIGTVKVTSLEGEPAIKVGNEPAVKVSALPELAAGTKAIGTVKVASLEGEPAVKLTESPADLVASVDSAGEAQRVALWFIAGLLVAGVLGYGLYRVVDRTT